MEINLKIDIDSKPFNRRAFDKKIIKMLKEIKAKKAEVTLKATNKGTHARITLSNYPEQINNFMVSALQLYLGSDINRELFNIGRIYRKEENWNVLFCRKWKNGKTISKEKRQRNYTIRRVK